MLGAQSFNNLLNANSFNHIFAPITPPLLPPQQQQQPQMTADLSNSSTTIIDLSTVGENDDDLEIVNVTATAAANLHRKRQHSGENINEHKRNRHIIYNDNQKNVPLKKRGVNSSTNQQQQQQRDDFLSQIASEDSNQAQNLKIACVKDSATACDSTSTSNVKASLPKHLYHSLEPKDIAESSNKSICNCFECFPALGSSGSRPKCIKFNRQQRLNNDGSSSSATIPVVEAKIDVSLLPGPSGLQKKSTSNTMPVKKRNDYYESDDDYDSDDQNQLLPLIPEVGVEVKNGTLTAPHLQLDWLSDEGTSQGEEEDDDVIFVSDRTEPIDLTADSDSENDARVNLLPSSVDGEDNIDGRLNGDSTNGPISSIWPLPINIEAPCHPNLTTTSNSTPQRTPIMSSSVELPPIRQQQNSPHVVITMNPRPRPIPTRPINFHDMITGNDVMLYDGSSSSSQQARLTVVAENNNSRATTIVHSSQNNPQPLSEPPINQAHRHHHHSNTHNNTGSNNNIAHNHQSMNYHHHRRHYYNQGELPSPSHHNSEPSNENNNGGSNNSQQQQQQQHVGRCPFMTEGHHYNRPRRLPRDCSYALNNGRPYIVHENLWRQQYQEQEIRRQYWSSTFNEPEVQVLRPPPATSHVHAPFTNDSFVHRLVPLANDVNNPTAVPPNDILNRNFDRLARMQRYRRSQ